VVIKNVKRIIFCGTLLLGSVATLLSSTAFASGNHPQAGSCTPEKPYFAICTHSLHSLEGWFGKGCYVEKSAAQAEAEQHADQYHKGKMRWTGISKSRISSY